MLMSPCFEWHLLTFFSLPRMEGDSYHLENPSSIDYVCCDFPANQGSSYII